jgi:hypothetical protein
MRGEDTSMRSREYGVIAIATVVLAVLVPAIVYAAGYFYLSDPLTNLNGTGVCRYYPAQRLADIYSPAAKVEGGIRRIEITTFYVDPSMPP